ncbi:MAG: hypothetical protein M3Y54_20975 [Bacteroidota bacterium]|nr:hypothetical protein [Bacteroidota bacterium]
MPELTWLGKDAIRHHHLEVPYRPFVPTATFTRNPARAGGGFRLNGPLANHYPDFVAHTARGNTLLIETKGDHLNNDDSAYKRRLGAAWATAAGRHYKYYMVFDKLEVAGSQRLATFPDLLAAL